MTFQCCKLCCSLAAFKSILFGGGTTQSFCGAAPTLLPGGGQKLTLSQKRVPGVGPVMKEAGEGRAFMKLLI